MGNKWAVVGMGFIYPRHVQAIKATGGIIKMSCDIDDSKFPRDEQKVKGFPDYSVLEYWTDWVEMFNHPRFDTVDSVAICAPNYLHAVIAREAILRGKRVLCEKPLSINGTENMEGVRTVLQLRYHPELLKMNKPKQLFVEAKMYRDKSYWDSWKGIPAKSGGILYNLGVHYVDLAVFLLGDSWEIIKVVKTDKMVDAQVIFGESHARIYIEVVDKREDQGRRLFADNKEITLSNQDNLSYEDLHTEVYKEFNAGRGITIEEAGKSLKLINAILNFNETAK